jgi:hypothetical protein
MNTDEEWNEFVELHFISVLIREIRGGFLSLWVRAY